MEGLVSNLFGSDSDSDDSLPANPTGVDDSTTGVDKMPSLDRDGDSENESDDVDQKTKISVAQAVKNMFSSASDSDSDSEVSQQLGIYGLKIKNHD